VKRSSARRDALSLFLEAPPRRSTQAGASPASPDSQGAGQQAQAPRGDDRLTVRLGFRTPCPRVLEWFVAESRCLMRLAARTGAPRTAERDPHTTSTRQAAPFRHPSALPLPDAGPGPVPESGA
jgi:hypothetical protein